MKRFDYLCILYSIALLAFGFDDNTPLQKNNVGNVEAAVHAHTIAYHEPAIAEHVATQKMSPRTEQNFKKMQFASLK